MISPISFIKFVSDAIVFTGIPQGYEEYLLGGNDVRADLFHS